MQTDETNAGSGEVDYSIRLPEAEFDVMMALWSGEPPMNTATLMALVGTAKGWKPPTLISFLTRLEERGYVSSEKKGKERYYTPIAQKDKYIKSVTEQFVKLYHHGSFVSLLNSLYSGSDFSESDMEELLEWLKSRY